MGVLDIYLCTHAISSFLFCLMLLVWSICGVFGEGIPLLRELRGVSLRACVVCAFLLFVFLSISGLAIYFEVQSFKSIAVGLHVDTPLFVVNMRSAVFFICTVIMLYLYVPFKKKA